MNADAIPIHERAGDLLIQDPQTGRIGDRGETPVARQRESGDRLGVRLRRHDLDGVRADTSRHCECILQGGGAGGVATVAQQHELTICRATGEQGVAEDDAVVHRCLANRLELTERRPEGVAVSREWTDERRRVGEPDNADRHLGGKFVEESDRRQLGGRECSALVHASRRVDQQHDLEAVGRDRRHLDRDELSVLREAHVLRSDTSVGEDCR